MTQRAGSPVIGLALGSGGARGWCHVGVLRGLEELGIRPAVVSGCSMGALVGAAHAAGCLDALEDWARALTLPRFLNLIEIDLAGGGLVGGKAIADLLQQIGAPARIEDLRLPFRAVASDMATGREIWLKSGPLASAVQASAALPGVLGPVYRDGRWLLDGGMTNPVPVTIARALGADVVIAVNPDAHLMSGRIRRAVHARAAPSPLRAVAAELAGRLPAMGLGALSGLLVPPDSRAGDRAGNPADDRNGSRAPGYFTVVNAAINMMTDEIRRSRLAGDPPHVLLNARLDDIRVYELYRAEEAIEEGRRMVMRHRESLCAMLEDRAG